MPTLPTNTKCATYGCTNQRSKLNTYCVEHGGKNTIDTEQRKAFVSMYQTAQWKQVRQSQLSRQPLCESCLTTGKVVQANHVDHVFAWARIGKDAFYNNLFQSLCHECHSVKTNEEKQGIFKHYATAHEYTINDYRTVMLSNKTPLEKDNLLY